VKHILEWQIARVTSIHQETSNTKTFTLSLPNWVRHKPGQHYDVRLTAPDGYQAQRSYSIASEPEKTGEIDLTVERIEDGEVSSYMHQVLIVGDLIEVRGPIGGYFVWEASMRGSILLVAGGSGVVPLMSMIRHRAAVGASTPMQLLYSSRTPQDVIYSQELTSLQNSQNGLGINFTFTRQTPADWTGYSRRIDVPMLRDVAGPLGNNAQAYVCGPTLMVEAVANGLLQIGLEPNQIRTERFGPTGSSG
jgi:ferredoxin-NADP reductase